VLILTRSRGIHHVNAVTLLGVSVSGSRARAVLALALAVIAFNLTRAAASVAGPSLAKPTTTIRRKLITVPARIASSARRLELHLPTGWPWQDAWTELYSRTCGPPRTPTP
jgi:hypothetical protein